MRRDLPFIAAISFLLIFFILLMYVAVVSPAVTRTANTSSAVQLPVITTAMTSSQTAENWTVSGMTGDLNMLEYYNYFVGDDGTVYTIDGKAIHAISPDGRIKWNLTIPDLTGSTRPLSWYGWNGVVDGGTFYITLQSSCGSSEFLAASANGKIAWQTNDPPEYFSASNGRLYACKGHNVTVYNKNGSIAWSVKKDFYPPLVDDSGTMYMVGWPNDTLLYVYSQAGKLNNTYNLTDYGLGPLMVVWSMCPQIYYSNHMVYVPLLHGMAAFDDGGAFKWKIAYSDQNATPVLWDQPFDRYGNVFLQDNASIFYITPDGKEFFLTDKYDPYWRSASAGSGLVCVENYTYYSTRTISATDGSYTNGYDVTSGQTGWNTPGPGHRNISLVDTCQVTAYDLMTGNPRWNVTLPASVHTVNATANGALVKSYSLAKSMLVNGTLFVNFWADNRADTGAQDGYAYAGGIYAIDRAGNILWQKPVDSRVLRMDSRVGRIIYCTADGNISSFKP